MPGYALVVGGIHKLTKKLKWQCENFSQIYNFYHRNFEKKNREREREKAEKFFKYYLTEYISQYNYNGGYNLYLYIQSEREREREREHEGDW